MSGEADVNRRESWPLELAKALVFGTLGLLLTAFAHGLDLRHLPSFESSEERKERIRREVHERLEAIRREHPAPTPSQTFDQLWEAASVRSSSR